MTSTPSHRDCLLSFPRAFRLPAPIAPGLHSSRSLGRSVARSASGTPLTHAQSDKPPPPGDPGRCLASWSPELVHTSGDYLCMKSWLVPIGSTGAPSACRNGLGPGGWVMGRGDEDGDEARWERVGGAGRGPRNRGTRAQRYGPMSTRPPTPARAAYVRTSTDDQQSPEDSKRRQLDTVTRLRGLLGRVAPQPRTGPHHRILLPGRREPFWQQRTTGEM